MGETGLHVLATLGLFGALKHYFAKRDDVYVAADMFLYYQEGKPSASTAPDVMVIKGVPNQERRIFKLWEEKIAPCAIFDVISRLKMGIRVTETSIYARMGVSEFFLFDPEGDYLDEQIIGYRLEEDMYVPIMPEADGTLRSQELGLAFWPERFMLRVGDPATGERIPTFDEAAAIAMRETERAKQEAARAEQEAARAAAAEAEVARLQALINRS
jgi:Uma2 family endonuclease